MIICLHEGEKIKEGHREVLRKKVQEEVLKQDLSVTGELISFKMTFSVVINGNISIKVNALLDFSS